jgi:hypothetical protein
MYFSELCISRIHENKRKHVAASKSIVEFSSPMRHWPSPISPDDLEYRDWKAVIAVARNNKVLGRIYTISQITSSWTQVAANTKKIL